MSLNSTTASGALHFSQVGEKRCGVAGMSVGQTSTATRKVTAFGPNWSKKGERNYMGWEA